MSTIRRQSIIASLVIYIGFAVGMLNTYFLGEERYFTSNQYGLITILVPIASMMYAFANLAMPSYIMKFYPYYKDHLPDRKNDMLTWALLGGLIGFGLVVVGGIIFKDLVIRKYSENSPELVHYYYWIFPLGLGLTILSILEVYAWNVGKAVLTNFLREVQWRLLTTVLIVLFIFKLIPDFDSFVKFYSFTYPVVAITLLIYLITTGKIHFTFSVSKVTRRYFKKIVTFNLFIYSGFLVLTIAQVFDQLVIASVLQDGMAKAGVFGFAQIMATVILAPQRGIIAAAVPHLSRAWKEKDMGKLQRIYQRSSLNQLIFSVGIFLLIAINYKEAILTFNQKEMFLAGFSAFILMGLTRVIEMGTGLNSQIIGTSTYWRFELISGICLLAFMLPLTVILARQFDILGPAIANLVSISLYNLIRLIFLWKKFGLFPFVPASLYTLLIGAVVTLISWWVCSDLHGFWGLVIRSSIFITLFASAVIGFKLSPDTQAVVASLKKRILRK
ncbi:MAG: lipopolysaccharide biosynthesis protein [Chitinophagaceae bacterium]